MIEQNLSTVMEFKTFLPPYLRKLVEDTDVPADGWKLSECWEKLANGMTSPENENFWRNCGWNEPEQAKALLDQIKPIAMLATALLSYDFLYQSNDIKNPPVDLSSNLAYKFLDESEKTADIDGRGNNISDASSAEYDLIRKAARVAVESSAIIYDPLGINPYLVYLQNREYAQKHTNTEESPQIFFPEIQFFLKKSIVNIKPYSILPENSANENNASEGDSDKSENRREKIKIHSSLIPIAYLLLRKAKYLPGHSLEKNGRWSMAALCQLEQAVDVILKNANPNDFIISDMISSDVYSMFIRYGFEDILHLNRISFAIKSYVDCVKEQHIGTVKSAYIANLYSALVYAPSLAIAEFLEKDARKCAETIKNDDWENADAISAYYRVMSTNSIIFPSVVTAFSLLIFKSGLNQENAERYLTQYSEQEFKPDELSDLLFTSAKVWKDANYCVKYNNQKKVNAPRYHFASVSQSDLLLEGVITALVHPFYTAWAHDTILFTNRWYYSLPHKVFGEERANLNLMDEFTYLNNFVNRWKIAQQRLDYDIRVACGLKLQQPCSDPPPV